MSRYLVIVLLLGCESRKPPPPPAPPPQSLFKTDRITACTGFADRVSVSMKNEQLPADQTLANDCMKMGRVSRGNLPCLLAAKSGDAVEACFEKTVDAGSGAWPTRADDCLAFARHVLSLMEADLRQTMIDACLAPSMSEADYDCVMSAKTDAAFKGCLSKKE
jgi:hypothetical protein